MFSQKVITMFFFYKKVTHLSEKKIYIIIYQFLIIPKKLSKIFISLNLYSFSIPILSISFRNEHFL